MSQGSLPNNKPLTIMIVTGEASADVHAATLLRELQRRSPGVTAFGMGASHLRAAGMEVLVDSSVHASVMGLTEVVGALGGILRSFRLLKEEAKRRKPDILLLLDFPDFNMRLARALKAHCRHCVYFITPQVWAWRRYRVAALRRDCSRLIPLFPFEEDFYRQHGAEARWLGHPFVDQQFVPIDREVFLRRVGLDPKRPVLALLPGSRRAEVERLAQVMRESWRRLNEGRPGIQAIVPVASSLDANWVAAQFGDAEIVIKDCEARQVLCSADAALVASGTATLEAAFCNVPFAVAYRMSPLTYRVGKAIIRGTKFIAIPNVIAGRQIVAEFLQDDCTAGVLSAELERLFSDADYVAQMRKDLLEVQQRLRYSGANAELTTHSRVAEEILSLVRPSASPQQQVVGVAP